MFLSFWNLDSNDPYRRSCFLWIEGWPISEFTAFLSKSTKNIHKIHRYQRSIYDSNPMPISLSNLDILPGPLWKPCKLTTLQGRRRHFWRSESQMLHFNSSISLPSSVDCGQSCTSIPSDSGYSSVGYTFNQYGSIWYFCRITPMWWMMQTCNLLWFDNWWSWSSNDAWYKPDTMAMCFGNCRMEKGCFPFKAPGKTGATNWARYVKVTNTTPPSEHNKQECGNIWQDGEFAPYHSHTSTILSWRMLRKFEEQCG